MLFHRANSCIETVRFRFEFALNWNFLRYLGSILHPIELFGAILAKESQQESYDNYEHVLMWNSVLFVWSIDDPFDA